jgi:hypothetical protein
VFAIAHGVADCLQPFFVLAVHFDEGQQCQIISRAKLVEMGAQQPRQRLLATSQGLQGCGVPLIGE